jgi:hypothetical protein
MHTISAHVEHLIKKGEELIRRGGLHQDSHTSVIYLFTLLPLHLRLYVDRTIGRICSWIKFKEELRYHLHCDCMKNDFTGLRKETLETVSSYRKRFDDLCRKIQRIRCYLQLPSTLTALLLIRFRQGLLPYFTAAMLQGAATISALTQRATSGSTYVRTS